MLSRTALVLECSAKKHTLSNQYADTCIRIRTQHGNDDQRITDNSSTAQAQNARGPVCTCGVKGGRMNMYEWEGAGCHVCGLKDG